MKLIKNITRIIIGGVLEVWQLPQHIVAWIIMAVLSPVCLGAPHYHDLCLYYASLFKSSFTLGRYSFCPPDVTRKSVNHEYGHYRQSLRLGPLYLFVICIPSVIHYIWIHIKRRHGKYPEYYEFYTERWANKLMWKD